MISTITTSTTSTITTASLAGTIGFIGIVLFLLLMVQKEVASGSESKQLKRLDKALNISLVPLGIAFILIVALKVFEVLS